MKLIGCGGGLAAILCLFSGCPLLSSAEPNGSPASELRQESPPADRADHILGSPALDRYQFPTSVTFRPPGFTPTDAFPSHTPVLNSRFFDAPTADQNPVAPRGSAIDARLFWSIGLVVLAWLVGLGLLFSVGVILSKLTLRSAERADPNIPLSSGERRLRSFYKILITFAGVYYYLSLPIVLIMVLGICGGIVFGFLTIGWVPIKLTIILAIGAVVTVVAMIKSLFIKSDTSEAGRALRRDEAPGLWQLTEDVAREMGTRPVDEIRLTPGTELAVYERGHWREKIRDHGERILLLGTGVLNGFRQDAFRSVLAHEYGHFSNRDTAGGDVALRVRNDMFKFYRAMYAAGQATTMNVAFHFLRIYNFIFRRISHGATRLQEILADRVAAQTYGTLAFESGLRHVVRRGLEFHQVANQEIEGVIKSKQPLQHIYEAVPTDVASIDKAVVAAIERSTTDDDTHPSPSDRFRLLAGVRVSPKVALEGEVWDLFKDRDAIKREMLAIVERQIAHFRAR